MKIKDFKEKFVNYFKYDNLVGKFIIRDDNIVIIHYILVHSDNKYTFKIIRHDKYHKYINTIFTMDAKNFRPPLWRVMTELDKIKYL